MSRLSITRCIFRARTGPPLPISWNVWGAKNPIRPMWCSPPACVHHQVFIFHRMPMGVVKHEIASLCSCDPHFRPLNEYFRCEEPRESDIELPDHMCSLSGFQLPPNVVGLVQPTRFFQFAHHVYITPFLSTIVLVAESELCLLKGFQHPLNVRGNYSILLSLKSTPSLPVN